MTAGQLAIVLRVPAPQGPHLDVGLANSMHRLDLLLTGRSGYPEYDIPPEDNVVHFPMERALLSCVGSQAALCVDNG
jgi:hypothetical protein